MSRRRRLDSVVRRIDATRLRIDNPQGVPVTLYANSDIPVDAEAIDQLLGFVSLQETLDTIAEHERAGRVAPFWGDAPGRLAAVVVTPDFHRGSGIPIGTVADARGFVIPQAVGKDVCCGMRLLVTDLTRGEIEPLLDRLAAPLRSRFFEGRAPSRNGLAPFSRASSSTRSTAFMCSPWKVRAPRRRVSIWTPCATRRISLSATA